MKNILLRSALLASVALAAGATGALAQTISGFTQGDLVISTVTGSALDTASPITLQEFSLSSGGASATLAGTLTLPQTASGANSPISGEYGSASEGFLQLSGNGQYLTIMGYGVNANTFNTAAPSTYGTAALGQTTSLVGGQYTTVPRVVALINGTANVDTSTALTGVFNTNNPRSAYTYDGSTIYVSGQGAKGDTTNGVFVTTRGSTTATAIDNTTDTRFVTQYNGALYVSRDYDPPGSGGQNYTNVSSLTNASGGLPTSSTGLVATHLTPPPTTNPLSGNNSAITLTTGLANGVNNVANAATGSTNRIGKFVYLSPEEFFFANATTLYVADSGSPKNGSANAAAEGEGGLQKWTLNTTTGVWTLDYDLVAGLNLVNNATANANTPTAPGVTGLFGLTGTVLANGQVELFATSYGVNELSESYLFEITDTLADTTITQALGESFTTLENSVTLGAQIRGVSFAPSVPEPSTWAMMLLGFGGLGFAGYRRARRENAIA